MDSISTSGIPAKIEEYQISANLNSSMLQNFLMRIYTLVYGWTFYIYTSRKEERGNRRVVLTAITVLYLLSFLNFVIQWYFLDWSLVAQGDTRNSMFLSTLTIPLWLHAFDNFLPNLSYIVSDGLICYYVWGNSPKVVAFPCLFLLGEIALAVSSIAIQVIIRAVYTTNAGQATLFNGVTTALAFTSLGTTVFVTTLIGYRIHAASQGSILNSKSTYGAIVKTVVESSAAYSVVLLFYAITIVIPSFNNLESPLSEVSYYVEVLLIVISGMAPTIMVARLALINTNDTVSSNKITHVSGLNFVSQHLSSDGSSYSRNENITRVGANRDIEDDNNEANIPTLKLKHQFYTHDKNTTTHGPV